MNRLVWVRAVRALLVAVALVACGASDDGERLGSSRLNIGVGQALVIRQVYLRSFPTGTYSRFFIEIYNKGTQSASLANLTVQAPGNGQTTGVFSAIAPLPAVNLLPGQSFLIASQPMGDGAELPISPDLLINYVPPSGLTGSKLALVNSTSVLPCGGTTGSGGGITCTQAQLDLIIDLVAIGSGNGATPAEGTAIPYPGSDFVSLQRKVNGTQDTNNNLNDFATGTPTPRNMDSSVAPPIASAPALGTAIAAPFGTLTGFVYGGGTGSDQTGVTAGAIDPNHAAWVTGYVKDGAGAALPGVDVSVIGQTQYGKATSRSDGRYDLIVNGGASYMLRYSKAGYFSADRLVTTGWQRTESVDDVLLVSADGKGNLLDGSGNSTSFQVASANKTTADTVDTKDRTAVLMIPDHTTVKVGSNVLASPTLRLTEYTAGANGLKRMPAPLTGSPAYTYAVELSIDGYEGQNVDFKDASNQPKDVFFYVEDFLTGPGLVGMPVGSDVPTGYYDRAKGAWVASVKADGSPKSGKVIKVSVTSGVASVDVDGINGFETPAQLTAFGITSAELSALAARYGGAGTVVTYLWRVPVNHMTPYDLNWPVSPPDCSGGVCPGPPPPSSPPPPPGCGGCCSGGAGGPGPGGANGDGGQIGSIIRCDSQSLGEVNSVAGTNFKLIYTSQRTPGFLPNRQIKLDLTGDASSIHPAETLIAVDISIAGQSHHREFKPVPNLSWTFQWDGLDGAGRAVVGSANATVKLRSYFIGKYVPVSRFGELPSPTAIGVASSRAFAAYERRLEVPLFGLAPVGS